MKRKKRLVVVLLTVLACLSAGGCRFLDLEEPQTVEQPSASRPSPDNAQGGVVRQRPDGMPYEVQVVADRLQVPWSIVFAPDGRIFFTERPGAIRVIEQGRLLETPVISFPAPFASEGEGGLLGLAIDPAFADNGYLYAYHSYREGDQVKNRVIRLRVEKNWGTVDKVLLDDIPGNLFHNGGRLKIGQDGHLHITTGDAQNPELAQDRGSLAGKILRITLQGTIPADNPFPGSPVYSLGHRNPQGLAWHPETGQLYSAEHGPSAHDEINLIVPGANYGWPGVWGKQTATGTVPPLLQSGTATWAPSGMTFVSRGPWQNRLLVANLRGQQVLVITFGDQPDRSTRPAIVNVEAVFTSVYGRIRDVAEAPDGSLYLLTNNRDGRGQPGERDDQILRLVPLSSELTTGI